MEINLCYKNKTLAFAIALAMFISFPIFFPSLRLYFFAPPIIMALYQGSRVSGAWYALLSGFCVDCFISDNFLGMNALSYTAAALLLHGQRKNFFADSVSTLPIMTFFFSLLVGLSNAILSYVFHSGISISPSWILSDLILMPLMDACYAFIMFILPTLVFGKPRRKGADFFLR